MNGNEKKIKVNLHEFYHAHKKGMFHRDVTKMVDDLFSEQRRRVLQGDPDSDYVYLSQEEIDKILACEKDVELEEEEDRDITLHRLAGMKAEKEDNLEEAARQYALCIRRGETAKHDLYSGFAYAFERIIVVWRKLKDYKMELYYIEKMLSFEKEQATRMTDGNVKRIAQYTKRAETVLKKLNKEQQ